MDWKQYLTLAFPEMQVLEEEIPMLVVLDTLFACLQEVTVVASMQ
jgi:hypothetical protein